MDEEQLFLFQVNVHSIVITDKNCLSERESNSHIYVQIKYPELDWFELGKVDFLSFQGKQPSVQSENSNASPSMIKLTSNQIFFSSHNIICNEGQSYLISMEPARLCNHFMENALQVILHESLYLKEPSRIISTSKFPIGDEMTQLILESMKRPGLKEAPAAIDKHFTLQSTFRKKCGYLQCTITVSCVGKTSEFASKNMCFMENHQEIQQSFSCTDSELSEEILDIEDSEMGLYNVIRENSTQIEPNCLSNKKRNESKLSRLISGGDDNIFSYYKGEQSGTKIDTNESYIVGSPKMSPKMPLNNNSIEFIPKTLPTKTNFTEVTANSIYNNSSSIILDDSTLDIDDNNDDEDDFSNSSAATAVTSIVNSEVVTKGKPAVSIMTIPVNEAKAAFTIKKEPTITILKSEKKMPVYSTGSNSFPGKTRGKMKIPQQSTKTHSLNKPGGNPIGRLWNERYKANSIASNACSQMVSSVKSARTKKDNSMQNPPVTIKKAKGISVYEPPPKKDGGDLPLSIVKQNSVYHVAIKNSRNRLDNVLKFKLYGDQEDRNEHQMPRRTYSEESLTVTVVSAQREK